MHPLQGGRVEQLLHSNDTTCRLRPTERDEDKRRVLASPCDAAVVQPLLSPHDDVKSAAKVVWLHVHDLNDKIDVFIYLTSNFRKCKPEIEQQMKSYGKKSRIHLFWKYLYFYTNTILCTNVEWKKKSLCCNYRHTFKIT